MSLIVHDQWLLTPERAAIHLPTRTAVLGDLHLGYDRVRQSSGEAVPARDLEEVLAPLSALLSHHSPRRLLIAGDLVEDSRIGGPIQELLSWLHDNDVPWVGLVPGNHDRKRMPRFLGLEIYPNGFNLGEWQVVHGDGQMPAGNLVLGHVHPRLTLRRGCSVPCFLVRSDRIILPAFSQDAAGVHVASRREFASYRCLAVAEDAVIDLGEVRRLSRAMR